MQESIFCALGIGQSLLETILKAITMKEKKLLNWTFIKIKNFCSKIIIYIMKSEATDCFFLYLRNAALTQDEYPGYF